MPKKLPAELTTQQGDQPVYAAISTMPQIATPRTLPERVDEAERVHGVRVYDEMYETDIYLSAALQYLVDRLLEHGMAIVPSIEPPLPGEEDQAKAIEYELAARMAEFCTSAFDALAARKNAVRDTVKLWALQAMTHGQSMIQATYEPATFDGGEGMYALASLRFIPRRNYNLVVRPTGEILGALGIVPGQMPYAYSGLVPNPETWQNFVVASRLGWLVLSPSPNGIGGTSFLRPAYRAWKGTRSVEVAELRNIEQFAGQSLVFVGPENGANVMNNLPVDPATGTAPRTINELIANIGAQYKSGVSAVLPHGTTKLPIGEPTGDAFVEYFARVGREKVMAVLHNARTLMESQRSSQADAGSAENIADVVVNMLKEVVGDVLRQQVLRPLIELNAGPKVATKFTPHVSFSKVSAPDISSRLLALSTGLSSGAVSKAMLPVLWRKWLGEEYLADPESESSEKPRSFGSDDDDPGPNQ